MSAKLHIRHIAVDVANLVYATAVNVFVRIVREEVANGGDVQFLGEQLCTVRSHTLQILNVLA